MPATSVTELLFEAKPRWSGTIGAGGVAASNTTTIPLSSAANLDNGDAYIFVINRVTSAGVKNELSEMETVIGELSGTNFVNCVRGQEGTAQAWDAGTVVEILFTATHWNKLITAWEVAHNQNGTHKSGLALPSPVITTPQINDTSADHQYILGVSELTADRTITLPLLTGNDDFVFEDHTQTLTNKTLTAPVLGGTVTGTYTLGGTPTFQGIIDGWTGSTDTWTYASASTFTIAGVDRTTTFTKGTRLKFTQTTVKYAVVVSSSFSTNTTVTIAVNTDYTIANAAITAPYYSYQASPQGYPVFFNWTPTFSASGSMTTASPSITNAMFNITGGLLSGTIKFQLTTGGTASTFLYFTYPVIPSTTIGDFSTVGVASTDTNAGVAGVIGYSRTDTKMYIRRYDSGNFALTASHYSTGVFQYQI